MVLAIFVDGFGLGDLALPANPLGHREWRVLGDLLDRAVALDACLDTPGLPQSATGQVTLFTGFNAARHAGRHLPGLPGPSMRQLLGQGTFYDEVRRRGGTATFLNAFSRRYLARMSQGPTHGRLPVSVTTLAAVRAGLPLRDAGHARRGEAIYHDLTGEMQAQQGEDVPVLDPAAAAEVALNVAREHDLTLFEYFLTDRAGHSQDPAQAMEALDRLDRFLAKLAPAFGRQGSLVVFSDHGNIEDLSVPQHTYNPVPLAIWSADQASADAAAGHCTWLGDVAGLLVNLARPGMTGDDQGAGRR
jgi:hypothetical protein